ncbi:MAG: FHA domain-containing protein [Firmicutes bacterium]|nr:FHA domain-containing protein [Bacillota bacterium]
MGTGNDNENRNTRWVDADRLEIPEITRPGFEAPVLKRRIWEPPAEADAADPPAKAQTPRRWQLRLLRMNSPARECFTTEEDRFTIGKSTDADYTIAGNPAVSRIHAVIYRVGNDYYLEDQGSLNHTFVNEEMITGPYRLRSSLLIRFANEDFLFTMREVTESAGPGI